MSNDDELEVSTTPDKSSFVIAAQVALRSTSGLTMDSINSSDKVMNKRIKNNDEKKKAAIIPEMVLWIAVFI
jgi:hypothetical protein